MSTHEEKLRALLPFAEYAHEDGCLCDDCAEVSSHNAEMRYILDYINDKVILREELLTVQETALMICENLYGDKLDESKPVRNLHIYAVAKIIVEAQNKKAGLV